MGQNLLDAPDHLLEVAILARLSVDLEPDGTLAGMAHRLGEMEGAHGRGTDEGLREVPGPRQLLRLGLEIAARQVDAHGVGQDVVSRLLGRDVAPALAQRHHELDLVVQILGGGRIGNLARQGQRLGRLAKEKGASRPEWPISRACSA